MEVNVKIEAPDLSAAILKLAEAITPKAVTTRLEQPMIPTAPAPITPAPTTPAPVPGPTAAPAATTPAPVPGPTAAPAATAGPSAATVPGNAPVPVVPVAAAPSYSMEQIATAGAALVDAGKRDQLLELLGRFGVQAVTQLQPAQFGVFAAELRALGAQI